jgi:hypothetical protein
MSRAAFFGGATFCFPVFEHIVGSRANRPSRIKYNVSVELLLSERQRLLIQLPGVRRSKPRNQVGQSTSERYLSAAIKLPLCFMNFPPEKFLARTASA